MSKKRIGELLVRQGALTPEQLRSALQVQLIHGAHLGTCLIELGFVDEPRLAAALAESYGVACVRGRHLVDLPVEVRRLVPRKLVEKHRAVPFREAARVLHLAMIDPHDIAALDEIASVTGCRVQAWVAPEFRVLQAMERHYRIPRARRHIALGGTGQGRSVPLSSTGPAASEAAPSTTPVAWAPAPESGTARESGEQPSGQASWWETAGLSVAVSASGRVEPPPDRKEDSERAAASVDQLASMLSATADPRRIATLVLDWVVTDAERSLLFRVDGTQARVWDWRGVGLAPDAVRGLEFSLTSEPIFELLAGEDAFRGPIPDGPPFRWFFRELEMELPREALLLPAYLEQRLVAVLYADGGASGALERSTSEYARLMRELEHALRRASLGRRAEEA